MQIRLKKTTSKLLDLGWTPPPFGKCPKGSSFLMWMASLTINRITVLVYTLNNDPIIYCYHHISAEKTDIGKLIHGIAVHLGIICVHHIVSKDGQSQSVRPLSETMGISRHKFPEASSNKLLMCLDVWMLQGGFCESYQYVLF